MFILPTLLRHLQVKNLELVGNKAKRRILKRVFQENVARQIFRKTNISYPLRGFRCKGISYVCVSGGKKCSLFEKFNALCFFVTPVLKFALLDFYRRTRIICKIYVFRVSSRNIRHPCLGIILVINNLNKCYLSSIMYIR